MPNYSDLINVNGEIRTKQGRRFKNPTELAGYLGIKPHQIDWGKIGKSGIPTQLDPKTPKPTQTTTPTPTTPIGTADAVRPPTAPQAGSYANLVNKGGTIYAGERAFKTPTELAGYLGIQPHQIDWGKIPPYKVTKIPKTPLVETPEIPKEQDLAGLGERYGIPLEEEKPLTPIQSIQRVFGPEWKPAPAFTPELQAQGIYGAVRIKGTNDVYTIGPGGGLETPESYQAKFGTLEQQGIVGEVSMEQAAKLGIVIPSDKLLEDLKPVSIDEEFEIGMTPQQMAETAKGIKTEAEEAAGVQTWRDKLFEAYNNLVSKLEGAWEEFTQARAEKAKELKLEEKSEAITEAETTYNNVLSAYNQTLEKIKNEPIPMNLIMGQQARVRTQMSIDLAPLATAIQIAQNNYDRAKEVLDEFADDWKQGMEWSLTAAQTKIDMVSGFLSEAQREAKEEAQMKLNFYIEDYNRKLETQEVVKGLMISYPQAGISIQDSFEDAWRKLLPYAKDEKEIKDRLSQLGIESAELDIALQKKALAKPYYKPTGGGGRAGRRPTTKEEETIKIPAEVDPQIDALARSYLRGESLGNLGKMRGAVLARAEELKNEPEFIKEEFENDKAEGMPYEDAIIYYGDDLGKEFIDNAYNIGKETSAGETITSRIKKFVSKYPSPISYAASWFKKMIK